MHPREEVVDERTEVLIAKRLALGLGRAPEHAIRDGRTVRSGEPRVVSQRLQFVHLTEDGAALDGGPTSSTTMRAPVSPLPKPGKGGASVPPR
jgi:hypothetical protein